MHSQSTGGRRSRLALGLFAAAGVVAAALVPGTAAQAATEASFIEIVTGPKNDEWAVGAGSSARRWSSDETVLRVPTAAVEMTPDAEEYGWIGKAGEPFWATTSSSDFLNRPGESRVGITVGPITAPPDLSSDDPHARLSIESVDGPGEFSLHGTPQKRGVDAPEVDLPQETFRFGTGTQRNGEPQGAGPVDSLPVGQTLYTKARFTASGMYCVNLRSEATLADGTAVSAVGTIRFAVGDEVSVDAECGTATGEELAPPAEPDAPAAPVASADGGAVTVEWEAPANDGGHPVTGYTVTLWDRGVREPLIQEVGTEVRSALFENVPAGYYTASVVATNEAGDSPASARSNEIVVGEPVRVVTEGHIDAISAQVDTTADGAQTLQLRAHHDDPEMQWMEWGEFVLYTDDSAQQRLPDVYTGDADYSFIGKPGTMTWQLPASQVDGLPWPGLSTESPTLAALADDATISVTLDAVTGPDGGVPPGDAAIWTPDAAKHGGSIFSTKLGGSPAGQLKKRGSHEHFSWSFTAPGVYCFAYTIEAEMSDGTRQTDRAQLTHVVGSETDPSMVVPCSENPYPEVTPLDPVNATDQVPYVSVGDYWSLASTLDGTGLHTDFVEHDRRRADRGTKHSIDDVILYTEAGSSRYLEISSGPQASVSKVTWDATTIDRDALRSDIDWRVTSVEGPGELMTRTYTSPVNTDVFDTSDDLTETSVWPGTGVDVSNWRVTAPGKYCIGMEWTATTASGEDVSDSAMLTAVVDGEGFEHDEDTLTRTCADGAEGTDPGEDPGEGEDPGGDPGTPPVDEGEWDVPNFTESDSGAVILNDGHIDVASMVENGALTTSIKDTIEFGRTEWRDPAETILQVLPDAQSTVPQSEQYRFLGEPGDAYWELPERQQPGLLWPGWSTEQIARDDLQVDSTVDWSLTDATGPGEFSLFASDPRTPGGVNVLFNTRDGITEDDAVEIGQLAHVHGSWAFSAEGAYCLAFERTATLASGEEKSHEFTLAFGVGETNVTGIDPAACFTEPEGRPDREDTSAPDLGGLDEGNRGGVEVIGDPFYPGQLVTAIVPQERAGEWVSVWLDEVWLGWAPVSASGELRVRTPSSTEPGDYRLVVEDREDALIGWAGIEIAPAPEDDDPDGSLPDEEPPADPEAIWDVENGTENEAGAIVLNDGHIDVASLLEDPGTAGTAAVKASGGSELLTRVKDTTESIDPTWHHPDRVVLQLLPESRMRVPEGEQWAFLGEGGVPYYQVSQSPIPGLLWPGWSTEAVATDATEGGFDWALTDKTGPGEFALYQTGSFGDPEVLFNTRDGIDGRDRFEIPKNAHAHGSWAFSEEGNYCLAFERSTTLTGGKDTSDAFVLALAVGRADVMRVDPADCFGEEGPRPPAPAPEDPDGEQPGGDGQNPPDGAEPDGEQPGGDRPDGEQPGGDGQNPPDGAEPDGEQPGGDRPDGEQPGGDGQNRPDGEQPDGDRHEGKQPDGDGQNPPEGEQPDGDQLHSPEDELSPTSGDLNTQLAAGGSVLLLLAGAGALWAARRRRSMGANSSR